MDSALAMHAVAQGSILGIAEIFDGYAHRVFIYGTA